MFQQRLLSPFRSCLLHVRLINKKISLPAQLNMDGSWEKKGQRLQEFAGGHLHSQFRSPSASSRALQ